VALESPPHAASATTVTAAVAARAAVRADLLRPRRTVPPGLVPAPPRSLRIRFTRSLVDSPRTLSVR
jgi:hypothetical protein